MDGECGERGVRGEGFRGGVWAVGGQRSVILNACVLSGAVTWKKMEGERDERKEGGREGRKEGRKGRGGRRRGEEGEGGREEKEGGRRKREGEAGLHLEIDPRGGEMSIYEKERGRSPVYMRG